MNRLLAIMILLAATICGLRAESTDSISPRRFPTAGIAAPAAGVAAAYSLSRIYPHGSFAVLNPGSHTSRGTGVMQYLPIATPWILKAAGVPTTSSWGRMAVAHGSGVIINAAITWGLKHIVDSPRPDATDSRSFPSGHTAWAFAGATMIERELGATSSWYTWGAYTFASAIAMERMIDSHHYPTDVVAGASIGILATHAGYYIADLIMGRRGIERYAAPFEAADGLCPALVLDNTLRLPVGPATAAPGVNVERRPALITSIGYEYPVGRSVSLSAAAEVESMPLALATPENRIISGPLTSAGVAASANVWFPLSERFLMTATVSAGWHQRFSLHATDGMLTAGRSTPLARIKAVATYRLARHLSVAAAAGLQASGYKFRIAESEEYGISAPATTKGTDISLLLSISTRYEF
ncbi:MAG: phosphatase PAP2 family protein [Bacteroides sp.]|nr:phosphatase PAP2 family protein [Bacteroides sp.]